MAGLDLRGRRVLVAGAGRLAVRRLPALLRAGARVRLVAPAAREEVLAAAASGLVEYVPRTVRAVDVEDAWYVLALTDDPEANRLLVEAASEQRIFCVRGDDGRLGTARTPASGWIADLTVAVLGDRNPRRSRAARDEAVAAVRRLAEEGRLPTGR